MARRIRARRSANRGLRERATSDQKARGPAVYQGPFMGTMQSGPARPLRAHGLADEHQDRGLLYVEKQIWDDAIAEFEKAVNLSPDFSEVWNNLGLCYLYINRIDDALECMDQAIRHFPGWHVALANLGLCYQKAKQKSEAIKYFQQAVNKNKNQPQIWCTLGETLEASGQTDEAVEAYRSAVQLARNYDQANLRLGMLLARRRNLEEAEGFLRAAVEQNPTYADAAGVLGAISARNGRLDEAKAFYEQAKSTRPDNVPTTASRGLEALQRYEDGIKATRVELQDSYEDLPSIAECMFNAGLVFIKNENIEMARSSFQTASDDDQKWADPRVWLGMLAASEGNPIEARRLWDEARQLEPDNGMITECIAYCCLSLGLNSEADRNFEEARGLGRDPLSGADSEDEDELDDEFEEEGEEGEGEEDDDEYEDEDEEAAAAAEGEEEEDEDDDDDDLGEEIGEGDQTIVDK